MANIHPLATVHPNAKLGKNVEVGPYAYIEEHVEIGDGSKILPHATIFNYVKMGKNCCVFPGAVVGAVPQDLKFDGEVTYVEIGDNVNIRECATINRGTKASGRGVTKIGNNVLLMSYTHVAHDCTVGNNCILVSYVGIAGETDVDDWATLGGSTVAHQFSRIGKHAFVGGGSKINKDVPPYVLCGRDPLSYAGVNIVGLRRRGFTSEQIYAIKDMYDIIYNSGMNVSDALAKIASGFPQSEERDTILEFIRGSKRGIIRGADSNVKGSIEEGGQTFFYGIFPSRFLFCRDGRGYEGIDQQTGRRQFYGTVSVCRIYRGLRELSEAVIQEQMLFLCSRRGAGPHFSCCA